MTQNRDRIESNSPFSVVLKTVLISRSTIWLVLSAVMVMVAVFLGWQWLGLHGQYPGRSLPVAESADKSYGVTVDLSAMSRSEQDEVLTRMQDLGLAWVRQRFVWSEIESSRGEYDWARWDEVVAATHDHGLALIAVLDTTPDWANPVGVSSSGPPQELNDFGRFAGEFAGRYKGRIQAYQIWDEPNLSAHWGERFVEPAAYARLLREAAVNIRRVDTQGLILTAALAPTTETGPLNLSDVEFLSQLYAANGARWFDVVAAEPYGFTLPPGETANSGVLNFARVNLLRQVMVANGDADKAIWLTSFGWSVAGPENSPWPIVSPAQQEQYTYDAVRLARAQWFWLGPVLFPVWDAALMLPDDPRVGLALVNGTDLQPAARAVESLLPSESVATVGVYPATHRSGEYEGEWRFGVGRADVPVQGPARLAICFEGTRLDLDIQRGAYKGFLYVSVDGQPANRLPQQQGRAYLGLYDPLEMTDTVTLARHLPDGQHVAVIEAEGGWYQWPVVGWRVSREAPDSGLTVALILTAALGLVSALLWMRTMDWGLLRSEWTRMSDTDTRPSIDGVVHLVLLAVAALGFFLVPGSVLSVLMAVPFFLLVFVSPVHGLALVAFTLPFFLVPKHLVGRSISMPEISLLMVAATCVIRRILAAVIAKPRALDWLAWGLAGLALVCAGLLVVPVPVPGLRSADWATAVLMLLPLAGVAAALAGRSEKTHESGLGDGVSGQVDWAVAGLTVLGLISALAAGNVAVAFHEFHVVFLDAAVFYALIRLLRPVADVRQTNTGTDSWPYHYMLVIAFLAGATVMAGYAIYQYSFTDRIILAEGVRRALGVYGSPNNLALLLGRSTPILIALAAFPSSGRRVVRAMTAAALVINLVALGLTFSRGALLVGLPAAIFFLLLMEGQRIWAAVLAVAVAAVGGILPVLGTERLRSMLDVETGTGFFRLRLWRSAIAMMAEHPWLGVGPDNFLYSYRTRYILPDAWQEPNLSHPHNILLDFGTRLGIAGIALLIWLQLSFWRLAVGLYRHLTPGPKRALVLGLMGSMVATLAHGLIDNSIFLVDLAFVFLLTLAIVANAAEDVLVAAAFRSST